MPDPGRSGRPRAADGACLKPACGPPPPRRHWATARMPGAGRLKERVLNLPLRVPFAWMFVPALFAGLCGCSVAAAKPVGAHAVNSPTESASALSAFAARIGVTCGSERGRLTCMGGKPEVGDYADVELHPGCETGGLFGVIGAERPVELRDKISPLDTRTIATLHAGQTVCIRAIGRAGERPFYYFVTAVPAELVPACRTNRACATPATLAAQRAYQISYPRCRSATPDALRVCASGWMWADDLTRLAPPSDAR